ncbi:hypothetical protein L2Y94_05475 [Luteibacter aegosomatis]|uniref:hypothetical protein n=1 Tax=Luteibacter aegosomatis TaxID=2911537 RepID=UPI001FF98BDF|nr:hypothetical protein [Luteibacter aegosomatis]UPG86805.1 hypothetical protein L2Y94_05475 [Luteibacter aegosomatis]
MDYIAILKVAAPLATGVIQYFAKRIVERRPRLLGFITAASAVHVQSVTPPFWLHSHVLVIRNEGKKVARGVRIRHDSFPQDLSVYPHRSYSIDTNPQGGREIILGDVVPMDQVTISYLYQPPLTLANVNPVVISEDGIAKILFDLPRPQPAAWLTALRTGFAFLGGTFLLFWLARAVYSYATGQEIISPMH